MFSCCQTWIMFSSDPSFLLQIFTPQSLLQILPGNHHAAILLGNSETEHNPPLAIVKGGIFLWHKSV